MGEIARLIEIFEELKGVAISEDLAICSEELDRIMRFAEWEIDALLPDTNLEPMATFAILGCDASLHVPGDSA